MKKLLSIALLFSALVCKADMYDWLIPGAITGGAIAASKFMDPTEETPLGMVAEGTGCEFAKRVLFNTLNQSSNLNYKIENGWKPFLIDSGLNSGAKILNSFTYDKDDRNPKLNRFQWALRDPLARTVLLFAFKNIICSAFEGLSDIAFDGTGSDIGSKSVVAVPAPKSATK